MKRNKLGQFTSEGISGKNNYNWVGGKVLVKCSYCKKDIFVLPCRIKRSKNIFCNARCKGNWQKRLTGSNSCNWKGGKIISKEGYIEIFMPTHHRAKNKGYVYEHILVAEKKYGRKIMRNEQVHHLNGIKDDNRSENLVVLFPKDHDRFSVRHAFQERIRELEKEKLALMNRVADDGPFKRIIK